MRADPVVFALGGWSVGVDAAPMTQAMGPRRARVSLAVFHVEVPTLLVPLVAAPAGGLRVLEDAVQVAVRFELGHGWWLGPEVYGYRLTYLRAVERSSSDGADFATVRGEGREAYAHVSVGWRWFPEVAADIPVVERVFLEPWATVGLPVFGTGGASVGGAAIADRGFNWHATVSVGVDVL